MGRQTDRRRICAFFFFVKTFLALLIAMAAIAFCAYRIYVLHGIELKKWDKGILDNLPNASACYAPIPGVATQTFSTGNFNISSKNRLEPPNGKFIFGFHLDWSKDLPVNISTRVGHNPALINAFINITGTDFQQSMVEFHVQQVALIGGMLELTVVGNCQLGDLLANNGAILSTFATFLRNMNSKYNVPILVRFLHEMNGNWFYYGQHPTDYVKTFRTFANYLHAVTNMTALMWSPNPGGSYPWGANITPQNNPDFKLLDSNGDGVITELDDPYGPYWPGSDYVDWVGLSLYTYDVDTSGQTIVQNSSYLLHHVSGLNWGGPRPYLDFYGRFSNTYGKPFGFGESGAYIILEEPDVGRELAVKQGWWRAIFQVSTIAGMQATYPNFKLIDYFEEVKIENDFANLTKIVTKDFTVTEKDSIRIPLQSDLQQTQGLLWADSQQKNLTFNCDGTISFTGPNA
ncbi:glycoside hydrolase superfamily [Polychytrium aggregatum]|uniref:glycoside hydrolase superfamily n=1 Tax=Polychytrium aggregatum TaxID=110093 RepID=UPI0022FE69F3|nr:glycoside hydrolase superfamily [Polychytrium aggregatum]KAI9202064.1 glycoside hydrolase superfamily [Polychytrium aggregatum]